MACSDVPPRIIELVAIFNPQAQYNQQFCLGKLVLRTLKVEFCV